MSFRLFRLLLPAFGLAATVGLAQSRDVPLTNWTVPAYRVNDAPRGLTAVSDVTAGTGGGVTVIAGVSGTDLVIDINGYFTDQYNPGVSFHAVSSTAPAIQGDNTGAGYGLLGTSVSGFGVVATTGGNASNAAVYATNTSTGAGASAVYGQHKGSGYGVYGKSGTGFGVGGEPGGAGANAGVVWRNTSLRRCA